MRRVLVTGIVMLLLLAACGDDDDAGGGNGGPLAGAEEVYNGSCRACHGASGGGGVGPALDEVLTVFPECSDLVRWITLGSDRWQDEVGPVYGAVEREIDRVMPGFEGSLDDGEIRLVSAWIRYRFAGGDAAAAASDCGVTE